MSNSTRNLPIFFMHSLCTIHALSMPLVGSIYEGCLVGGTNSFQRREYFFNHSYRYERKDLEAKLPKTIFAVL
jgi:hypothetical protein